MNDFVQTLKINSYKIVRIFIIINLVLIISKFDQVKKNKINSEFYKIDTWQKGLPNYIYC